MPVFKNESNGTWYMGNLLHQYALKNKEVSKIEVAHKERRIHVTYSCKNDLWYEFDLRNRGLAARSLHIPKKNMVISGLKEKRHPHVYRPTVNCFNGIPG